MITKFIITIVLLTLTNMFSHQADKEKLLNNDLTIQLSSETDTCYHSDGKIIISVKFKNNGLSSLRINKNMLVTTHDIHKDAIKVKICHDNKFYEYAFLDGKEAMPRKCKLRKLKTLQINDIIHFSQLVTKTEDITNIRTSKIDNKDFGAYQLQALYIMNTNDTIFSNWITINYLE